MARLFSKLRGLMREFGDTQDDLARVLLLGRVSVSNRMRGAADWKLGEMTPCWIVTTCPTTGCTRSSRRAAEANGGN